MSRFWCPLVVSTGLLVVCCSSSAQVQTHASPTPQDAQTGHIPTAVVVQIPSDIDIDRSALFTAGTSGVSDSMLLELNRFVADAGAISAQPVLLESPGDAELAARHGLNRMFLVQLDGSQSDSAEFSSQLNSRFGHALLHAEPVRVGSLTDNERHTPNDPGFPYQYSLENLGQTVGGIPGLPGADVRATRAWSLSSGSGHITIAVLDSGVSYEHPDLFSKIVETCNVTGFGAPNDANDPFNSHGTHVAGIAAANSNNNEGMTGMSWGSPLMAIKVANLLGFTSDVWLGQGLIWAADHEARVAVVSIGLDSGSDFLRSAVRYATDRGLVICASTGNTGQPGVKYPAKYPETIAVGATDSMDVLAGFSTTGPEVTVTAPGVDILSTWDDFFSSPTYVYQSGTSSACPLVAGVVALMLSENPELNTQGVMSLLKISSIDKGAPGFDNQYGFGRIDAYRAVAAAKGIRVCPADVNLNGRVENSDFSAWLNAFNERNPLADQNFDGAIEPSDFSAFLSNFYLGCD